MHIGRWEITKRGRPCDFLRFMYYGMIKPVSIILGKAPSKPVRALGDTPNIMGKGKGNLKTNVRSGRFNNLLKYHVQQTFWSLLQVYDHHWKIMSYNVMKIWHNLSPQTLMWKVRSYDESINRVSAFVGWQMSGTQFW